ncbi:hypothetical protein FI667_g11927, partial [Globisporangium splendens]
MALSSSSTLSEDAEGLQFDSFDADFSTENILLEELQLSTELMEFMVTEDSSFRSTLPTPTAVSGDPKVLTSSCKPHVECAATEGKLTKERSKNAVTLQRNKYREKRKREVQFLRDQIVKLEDQLTSLRERTTPRDALFLYAWKQIAKKQRGARQRAEDENAQLKRILRSYKEITRKMNDGLKEADLTSPTPIPEPTDNLLMPSHNSDMEVLSELANDLDASFARMDAAFETAKIQAFDSDFVRYGYVNSVNVPYIEVVDISVSALSFQQVANNMWCSTVYEYTMGPCCEEEKLWHTEDSLAAKAQIMCRLASGEMIQFNYRMAAKKFVDDENRVVVVWRGRLEGQDNLLGTDGDETGWMVVEPRSSTSSESIIRTYSQITSRPQSGGSNAGVIIPNFLNVLLTLSEEPYQKMSTTLAREIPAWADTMNQANHI